MKLRINQLSTSPPYLDLPDDLTGYAVTLDLSHCDAASAACSFQSGRFVGCVFLLR